MADWINFMIGLWRRKSLHLDWFVMQSETRVYGLTLLALAEHEHACILCCLCVWHTRLNFESNANGNFAEWPFPGANRIEIKDSRFIQNKSMPYFYYATHNEDRQSAFHTQRTQTIAWWIAAIATHKHQFPGVGRSATERERREKSKKKKMKLAFAKAGFYHKFNVYTHNLLDFKLQIHYSVFPIFQFRFSLRPNKSIYVWCAAWLRAHTYIYPSPRAARSQLHWNFIFRKYEKIDEWNEPTNKQKKK